MSNFAWDEQDTDWLARAIADKMKRKLTDYVLALLDDTLALEKLNVPEPLGWFRMTPESRKQFIERATRGEA